MSNIHPYIYKAEVREVVDGDTYDFDLDLGFNIKRRTRIRLLGVDTAEIHTVEEGSEEYKKGMAHKRFVEDRLSKADGIFLRTHNDPETGTYGRWLGEVLVDGDNLSDLLTEEFPELLHS